MLKSLELFGFKSFADKTVFEFHEGITGVVGPNGSGKSNVVDSIKWLLGDQSAKSLRGKEMTDVIFNGSSSRGAAQFAEATLVFDNSSRFLPLDHDEVSVGRRLWKSGDSEYLINRTTSRLKDVRELLMGTGAGAASYCIIEQGRVDQILQSNAANRRLIFEEAAGISRFKQRRNEAERRLDRVEQNLLRLTDIVEEVESQVNAVRSRAKRALQLREVSTELEQLWVGMVADDYRRQFMLRESLTRQKQEASAHLEDMHERQKRAEQELADADQALAAVNDELQEVERSRAELRSRIASLETTLRHHAGRESELQSECRRLQRQQGLMDGRVAEAEKEEVHLKNVLSLEQKRFSERKAEQQNGMSRLDELHASLKTAQDGLLETRREWEEKSRQNTELTTTLGGLQHQYEALQQRQRELADAREILTAETADTERKISAQTTLLESAQNSLNAAEEAADRLLTERDSLLNEQSESRESLANLREQRSAAVARKTVLEDLEDRQEGFGLGTREILKRSEEGTAEPWNLIRGSVADLLDVDMDNAALLEVALSGRAQLLVIDRLAPLIDYLNSGNCQITDRVGFVSLEEVSSSGGNETSLKEDNNQTHRASRQESDTTDDSLGSSWSGDLTLGMFGDNWLESDFDTSVNDEFIPQLNVTWVDENGEIPAVKSVFSEPNAQIVSLTDKPGIVGRADSLARSPKHLPDLASQLLADTWVVRSLDDALRLQEEFGDAYRFVTLQGELVEKDRSVYTGSIRSESAVVSRKSELRRLKNELHRIEHLVSERDLRLKKLVASIESADDELQDGRDNVDRCAAELRANQQTFAELQQLLNTGRANEEKLATEISSVEESAKSLQQQIAKGRAEYESADRESRRLQELIEATEKDLTEDRRQVEALEKGRTEADLELTRSEERLLGIGDAVERLTEDVRQRRLQQQEATRRLNVGAERLAELNLSQLNVNAEIAELRVYDDELTNRVLQRSEARQLLTQHRQDATAVEQEAREVCRRHESMFHETEMRISSINHQLETASERIQDEFQISLNEAVESGRSAIASWLSAETGDSDTDSGTSTEENTEQSVDDDPFTEPIEYTIDDPQVQQILRDDDRYDELRGLIDQRISTLRKRVKKLGNVGTDSLDNLNELETRFQRLDTQLKDLEAARDTLRDMVRHINVESRRMFLESFECIREHFRDLFRRLFGGGEADVILEDADDVLECAIDVVARPPGKELRSITLLSGGEKTMTAVALLLSIFKSRPSPFCILDEVDAALDDANIGRFVGLLKDFQQNTQFIMITHRKPTMSVTDVLYGVTMEESGISKRLAVRFEEIDDKGNFIPRDGERSRAA